MARTRVIAYARVSTTMQATDGMSLAAQEAKLRAYCELHELHLIGIEVDAGMSAATLERPGLARALGMLRARKADALLAVKLDRVSRDVRDLLTLVEDHFSGRRAAALMTCDGTVDTRTASGRMVLSVMGSVAAWEREAVGERTSAAMQHMRATGQYTGGAARYGYALGDGGALVAVEDEQEVIRQAKYLRGSGMSLRDVSRALEERGLVARNGRPFAAKVIASITAVAP